MLTADEIRLREMARAFAAGQSEWGVYGSVGAHLRYAMPRPNKRKRCQCGCKGAASHSGCVNGVAMMGGCELHVRRWVRDPLWDQR